MIRHVPILAMLLLVLGLITPDFTAADQITNRGIKKRITLMFTAQAAAASLTNMMAGRIAFQADKARAARRILIQASRSIPKRFKKRHSDPLSNARPEIWLYWGDFKIQAKAAETAAKQLNANSLNGLRRTLPSMLQTCLSCHNAYRSQTNEFVTH